MTVTYLSTVQIIQNVNSALLWLSGMGNRNKKYILSFESGSQSVLT